MSTAMFAAALLVTTALPWQIGRLWSFKELVAESDLVIVGKVIDVRDTGRKAKHPELRPDLPVVELETEVEVLGLLKSSPADNIDVSRRIVLLHYRIDMDEWRRQHPPSPGQPPPGLMNAGDHLTFTPGKETYLLFLKRGRSGWEPTTGHTFPRQSVFPLGGANRIGG
jgi:hypothetical protein